MVIGTKDACTAMDVISILTAVYMKVSGTTDVCTARVSSSLRMAATR